MTPSLLVSMIALGVKDMARSIKFYSETLGMQLAGQPGEVTRFHGGGVQIALNHPLGNAAGSNMVGAVEVIFSVDGVVAAHLNLVERGCKFIQEPREVFAASWAATFTDPDGHRLTIFGPR
ncbi:MAG TPA: VOC family protein [Bryobacteraceae bacterium]|nr:VOC family protein [Bryobacteraceae bacterium]